MAEGPVTVAEFVVGVAEDMVRMRRIATAAAERGIDLISFGGDPRCLLATRAASWKRPS